MQKLYQHWPKAKRNIMKQHIRIKKTPKNPPKVTHNEVAEAVANFLKKGGEIQKVEPLWLDERENFDVKANNL